MPRIIIFPNYIEMNKSTAYRNAKTLATELGFPLATERALWRGSTTQFWRNRLNTYQRNIRNRNNNYDRALRVSREIREPLRIPNRRTGTTNAIWIRELRRLRMRARRAPARIQAIQAQRQVVAPILRAVAQRPARVRQQARAQQLQQGIQQAREKRIKDHFDGLIRANNFNEINRIVINDNHTLTAAQAQTLWNKIQGQGRHVMTITKANGTSTIVALNNTTKDWFIDLMRYGTEGVAVDGYGSDVFVDYHFEDVATLIITKYVKPARVIKNKDGRFFPYINTTNLDLLKYQIFNQEEAYDEKLNKTREHCLIHTFLECGVDKALVNNVKMAYVQGCNIRKKDLKKIANTIKRKIILNYMNSNDDCDRIYKSTIKATVEDGEPIEIALYENHYFVMEETKYSKYSITNYADVKDEKKFYNIVKKAKKKYYERMPDVRKCNSLLMVHKLFKAQHFKKLDLVKFEETASHTELKDHIYLENIKNEQKKCKNREQKIKIDEDFEYTEAELKEFEDNKIKMMEDIERMEKELDDMPHCDCNGTCEFCLAEKEDVGELELENINEDILDEVHKEFTEAQETAVKFKFMEEVQIRRNRKEFQKSVYYADCESYVNGDFHTLQLLGVANSKDDMVDIMNINDPAYEHKEVSQEQLVVNQFLSIITRNGRQGALCYFHNLKYDYHLLEPYINITGKCEKDNSLYSIKIKYKKQEVELRDSYKLLPFALSKFQKEFGLAKEFGKKEAIAYDYYTKDNDNKRIPTREYRALLSSDEKTIFTKGLVNEPSYDPITKTFNPMDYYKEYLRLDCLVLKKGIETFETLINEITESKMSVFECLTISSLTDKYMKLEGAYENVYEVCGNLRAYIAKAVYGGRVCVNKKYQKKVVRGKISDFDGVSLYPSAINRLCRELGLPIGKAKRFNKEALPDWDEEPDFDEMEAIEALGKHITEWENTTYAIMTVKITKVNKNQQMPFIAHKNDGSILYTNTAPEKPIIIDSITLQDYIKFHQIEYEILDGVYWNGGGNKKMGEVIQRLFTARLNAKDKKQKALSNVIKLMLNSSYGKTIMKKTTVEKKIVSASKKTYNEKTKKWTKHKNSKFESYVYNNFNTIKKYRKLNEHNYEVEKICSDNTYNRGHIGCAILSMSKRIMNEVFDVANTEGFNIYYTDTDSLHCDLKDVNKLNLAYFYKYKKALIGTALEQFHTDFDLDGAVSEIYATKSIFLGKKSYIDYLESTNEKGETIHGHHIRLKGITEAGLEHTAKTYSEDKKTPEYFKMYEDLAKGTVKTIVLNPFNPDTNKNKVLFEFKQGKVSTRKEFSRKVKF